MFRIIITGLAIQAEMEDIKDDNKSLYAPIGEIKRLDHIINTIDNYESIELYSYDYSIQVSIHNIRAAVYRRKNGEEKKEDVERLERRKKMKALMKEYEEAWEKINNNTPTL